MTIEETIMINAPLSKVWELFRNLTCWANWNSILRDVSSAEVCLVEGGKFSCCIRPYAFSVYFQPKVVEVIPEKKIVWTGSKYGVSSLHEFFFEETAAGTSIRSREVFSGIPIIIGGFFFPKKKLTALTVSFLEDLRRVSEAPV